MSNRASLVRAKVTAYVAIGANLGDAQSAVLAAMRDLAALEGVSAVRGSSLYRSAPVDAGGPDFINAVVAMQTSMCAPDLLGALQRLEQAAGRQRPYRNAPRTLDLDLILYGQARIESPHLTVPHPRWRQRAFVVLPLRDLAPDWVGLEDVQRVADQAIERIQLKGLSAL